MGVQEKKPGGEFFEERFIEDARTFTIRFFTSKASSENRIADGFHLVVITNPKCSAKVTQRLFQLITTDYTFIFIFRLTWKSIKIQYFNNYSYGFYTLLSHFGISDKNRYVTNNSDECLQMLQNGNMDFYIPLYK